MTTDARETREAREAREAHVAAYRRQWSEPVDGPAWLRDLRARAMARFEANGFPTPRNEDWHFTNPAPITEAAFEPMKPALGTLTVSDVAPFALASEDWPTLVFVNGRYAPQLSRVDALPAGVRVLSLASALHEEPTLLERHMGRIAGFDAQALAFSALNTALMKDGAVLYVERNTTVTTPIHLLYLSDAGAEGGVSYPRNLFVVESNASVSVVEQYATTDDARYFTDSVTESIIADGATLRHYRVQREGRRAFHVGHVEATLGRDSHYVSFSFASGGALSRANIYANLAGEGCGATLNGLYMIDGEQVCDHQTRIEHAQPNCYSREIYKGVLDGASHGVFNGKVYVHPVAQKTDGKQTNNTLLLSDRARIDTKPQLEIFADDVKCTHGATVGQLDERMAFYMKSRGVGAERTRQLLTYAFAADVLETIELDGVRESLERIALERFAGAEPRPVAS
ncbi:MAG: Fe-S cluster assembly protein SufD [Gemmatimonadaceae bacterium]|nr:Fe-S cluster assembly protein SufD [Gemmatimonadaceae bacterium]